MGKLVVLLLIMTSAFSACSKDDNVISREEPQMVEVSLDYSLLESRCMTRNGDNVYASFYKY